MTFSTARMVEQSSPNLNDFTLIQVFRRDTFRHGVAPAAGPVYRLVPSQ
jgi:hypothetical protein